MREKTLSSRTFYKGRILDLDLQEVELEPGHRAKREIVRHRPAVAVLGELGDGAFVLVKQYRKPVECDVLEIVAGVVEEGEAPEACAAREVQEETGYDVQSLVHLGDVWSAAGYCDEVLHLFHARLVPCDKPAPPDEDERIEVVRLTGSQLEEMIERGEIRDAKTLAALYLWKKKSGAPAFVPSCLCGK